MTEYICNNCTRIFIDRAWHACPNCTGTLLKCNANQLLADGGVFFFCTDGLVNSLPAFKRRHML